MDDLDKKILDALLKKPMGQWKPRNKEQMMYALAIDDTTIARIYIAPGDSRDATLDICSEREDDGEEDFMRIIFTSEKINKYHKSIREFHYVDAMQRYKRSILEKLK
jgi:hypothetical protein